MGNSNRLKDKIYITQPFLPPLEEYTELLNQIWENKQLTNKGPFSLQFEEALAKYLNVKYISIVNNATIGLIIAQRAIGFTGDIITTPFSFSATAHSIKWNGLNPIFVDTDKYAGNLDPGKVQESITKNTGGILAVHNYGMPGNVEKLSEIADQYNIPLIYDAAPAIGAKFKNKLVGTFGIASAFSFQGAKLIVAGEGGILITSNTNLYMKIKQLAAHGRTFKKDKNTFWIEKIGYKYAMSNIQAALCLAQFQRLKELISKKRKIFSWYSQYLKDLNHIKLNKEKYPSKSVYWMTTLFIKKSLAFILLCWQKITTIV